MCHHHHHRPSRRSKTAVSDRCSAGEARDGHEAARLRFGTRRRHRITALALGLSVTLAAGEAAAKDLSEISAVDKETARKLLDEGDALFEEGKYEPALEKYQAADEIMGVPTTTLPTGQALEKLGRLVEARDAYLRVIRYPKQDDEPEAFTEAREKAEERAAALEDRIPDLTLVLEGGEDVEPVVKIDGVKVSSAVVGQPMSVDPGEREITVEAPGHRPVAKTVTLEEAGEREVTLTLEPGEAQGPEPGAPAPEPEEPTLVTGPPPPEEPPPEESDFPVYATIGFSVGAAGLILGGVTGGLSLAKTADLEEPCGDNICPTSEEDNIDEAELLANLSNVGFAVGGAGVLFGVVALFTLDASDDAPTDAADTGLSVEPVVAPNGLWLKGAF